jgi:hypothetical protein
VEWWRQSKLRRGSFGANEDVQAGFVAQGAFKPWGFKFASSHSQLFTGEFPRMLIEHTHQQNHSYELRGHHENRLT